MDSTNNLTGNEEKMLRKRVQEGRLAAIRFLGLARKPSGRIEAKLREQGFSKDEINEVIRSLQEEDRIDDKRLALNIIKRRRGRLAESRRALALRLQRSGISLDVIDQVLPEKQFDFERAEELVQSRFAKIEPADSSDARKNWLKIARYLAGKGFDEETIRKVLDRYFSGIDTLD